MKSRVDIEQLRRTLQAEMDRKGIKAKPLGIAAGLGETAVRDLMEKTQDPRLGTLTMLAQALEIPVGRLVGEETVPLLGKIGAGGSIVFEDTGDYENVPRPPGITIDLDAMEVCGDSMWPRYSNGDVLYVRRDRQGVEEAFIGEFCAVRLHTGETYVKLLARGSRPGFFTLRSLNAPDIDDVELAWATPVLSVLPRAARQLAGIG